MAGEFYTFEEVLGDLQIDKQELMKLVSQGELRCFRDGRSMKFRRDDVVQLKQGKETEPTIILTDSDQALGIPDTGDELLLDDSELGETVLNVGLDDEKDAARATQAVKESDEGSDELSLSSDDELDLSAGKEEEPEAELPTVSGFEKEEESGEEFGATEFGVDEGAGGADETLVDVGGATELETESFELVDEEEELQIGDVSASARIQRSARLRAMQLQQKQSHVGWTVTLLMTSVLMIVPVAVFLNTLRGVEPTWVVDLAGKFQGIVDFFYSTF